jgi:hypothetical protein
MSTWFFVFMGFLLGWTASAVWDAILMLRESDEDVHKG